MRSEIQKIVINGVLVVIGSVSAGMAAYQFTGDPVMGFLTFSAAIGLVGAVV